MMNLNSIQAFVPPTEIKESRDNYQISLEIPGLDKGDIKIWSEAGKLTVTAEKKLDTEGRLYGERVAGQFMRQFLLPQDAEMAKVEADYVDGVIRITIPKAESAKPKTIKIK